MKVLVEKPSFMRRHTFVTFFVLSISAAITRSQVKPSASPNAPSLERIVFVRSDQPGSALSPGRAAVIVDPSLVVDLRSRFIEIALSDGTDVIDLKTMGTDPSFSKDGKRIAFASNQSSNRFQICALTLSGNKQQELTHLQDGDAFGPAWSPDDKRIAFFVFRFSNPFREPSLYVMDDDGGNLHKIADHASEPTWSPDGKRIAFTSSQGGKFEIASVRDDGSERKQLTTSTSENSSPAWSPDGATLAFVSDRQGRLAVFLMNPDGSDQQRFVFSKKEEFCFPAWSRHGDQLAFTSLVPNATQLALIGQELPKCRKWAGEYQIYTVGPDGKNPRQITPKSGGLKPSFGLLAH